MTKISYIAGIGNEESAQRAEGIKPQPFIPYLSMTEGEMTLALMQEQAQILAGFYGDPKYKQAEAMLQNALYRGIHSSTPYLGAYDPMLTGLAKAINRASRQTRPAAGGVILGRQSMVSGIHIGEPVIDYEAREAACRKSVEAQYPFKGDPNDSIIKEKRRRGYNACTQAMKIEKILNDGIENCGQYLAYGYLPKNNSLPQIANQKIYNQELAQSDIGRVGKFSLSLVQQWLNVGMMRKNAEVAKVEPYGWADTNALLTMLPEAGVKEIVALLSKIGNAKQSKIGGISKEEVGRQLAAIVKKYQGVKGIGVAPAAVAIITAITALIGSISEFVKAARAEQLDAFSQVQGFGARPFGPEDGDFDKDGIPDSEEGSGLSTPILLGGAALLAWAVMK